MSLFNGFIQPQRGLSLFVRRPRKVSARFSGSLGISDSSSIFTNTNGSGGTGPALRKYMSSSVDNLKSKKIGAAVGNMGSTTCGINILEEISQIRDARTDAFRKQHSVGLVPTMGALHDGHLKLVQKAADECSEVWVSIFVNPTQFGVNEDLSSYPRTFEEDLAELGKINKLLKSPDIKAKGAITTIFYPSADVMYPVGLSQGSHIAMNPTLTQVLEGKSRPSFFQGVTTVVMKLLNIMQPTRVYFGQKDIQQVAVVKRMIDEFHVPTSMRIVDTVRHSDGLAMSSRNRYLGQRRRSVANTLNMVLHATLLRYNDGARSREELLERALKHAEELRQEQLLLPPSERALFEIDYLSLADPMFLTELESVNDKFGAILSGAMVMLPLEDPSPEERLGLGGDVARVRLIDNLILGAALNYLSRTSAD